MLNSQISPQTLHLDKMEQSSLSDYIPSNVVIIFILVFSILLCAFFCLLIIDCTEDRSRGYSQQNYTASSYLAPSSRYYSQNYQTLPQQNYSSPPIYSPLPQQYPPPPPQQNYSPPQQNYSSPNQNFP